MSQSVEEQISDRSGDGNAIARPALLCVVGAEAEDGCRTLLARLASLPGSSLGNGKPPLCQDEGATPLPGKPATSVMKLALSSSRAVLQEVSCDARDGSATATLLARSEVLILLTDVSHGVTPAVRRIALMAAVSGVSHVILLVNKMDRVDYAEEPFRKVRTDFLDYAYRIDRVAVSVIPVSALIGDNLLHRSAAITWYDGPVLTDCLEGIDARVSGQEAGRVQREVAEATVTGQFEAALFWLNEMPCLQGRSFSMLADGAVQEVTMTNIKYRIATDTLAHEAVRELQCREVGVCNMTLNEGSASALPVGLRFALTDPETGMNVAVGVIRHGLRRAQNLHEQSVSIDRMQRERLNGHAGRVIWFTGLSGAGKSTLANALEMALHKRGLHTYLLDGDNVRLGLNRDLGFTDADRVENIRRIAEVAKLMMDAGLVVMTAFISPFRRDREMARELIGAERFIEIHVSTPLDVCRTRDVKGLYRKAELGRIPNMTGINSPYEAPEAPDLRLDTQEIPLAQAVQGLMDLLASNGLLPDA